MKVKILLVSGLTAVATAAAVVIASPAHAVWTSTSDRRVKKDIVPVRW
jgi:hypothetical protein